jgi:hypothetical protein
MSRRGSKALNRGPLGVVLAAAGAVMLFLGWYGVSGRPNLAEQMPYIASGTIPGAALVVAAAIVLMGGSTQRGTEQTSAMVADLHSLLVEEVPPDPDPVPAAEGSSPGISDGPVTVIGTKHYHRGDCALVAGKAEVVPVDQDTIDRDGLVPCPICHRA